MVLPFLLTGWSVTELERKKRGRKGEESEIHRILYSSRYIGWTGKQEKRKREAACTPRWGQKKGRKYQEKRKKKRAGDRMRTQLCYPFHEWLKGRTRGKKKERKPPRARIE